MNYRFNIVAAVTYMIDWVLEIMFKFMLSSDLDQVEFFDIFDPNRIVAIVKRIRRRLNEF